MSQVTPVCFGVACEKHASCARYHAVVFCDTFTTRIATCGDRRALYEPIFIVKPEPAEERRAAA